MNDELNDKEIVELYLARKEEASEHAFRKYATRLRRLASTLLADKRDVEECVNDTLLKAWRCMPPNNPDDLYLFLARICRYTAIDIIRKNNASSRSGMVVELTQEMEECIPFSLKETVVSDDTLKTLINGFLGSISGDKRTIFIRHYWFGESISEISERYGFSESKIKTSLHRTRESFRRYLEKKGVSI